MIAGYEWQPSDEVSRFTRPSARATSSSRRAADLDFDDAPWSSPIDLRDYDLRQSDWDRCVPLPRADVRRRVGRSGRRAAGLTLTLAALTFVAACASAVRSVPDATNTFALASNDRVDTNTIVTPLPKWRPLRTARSARPVTSPATTNTALGRASTGASTEGVPDVSQELPKVHQASLEDRGEAPSIFGKPGSDRVLGPTNALTELVAFDSAPFPYDGTQPQGGPFLDVAQDGQRGHRTRRGRVLWESTTFNDRRVLVHIPAGFDPDRPAVLVVFFHGFGATLTRDVLARQQVPAQISASGANAILLAPQFAVDARDASAGRFWEAGGFSRFLREASQHLAQLKGNPALQRRFAKMPVVLVAYSGGFVAAAWSLKDVAPTNRVRGVVLLDAAYGELERFANFAATNRSSFLVSAYTRFTQRQNGELERMLAARGVSPVSEMTGTLSRGGAVFLATGADASHEDYVTQAWTGDPIKDILARLPEFRLHDPRTLAAVDRSIRLSQSETTATTQ